MNMKNSNALSVDDDSTIGYGYKFGTGARRLTIFGYHP